MRLDEATARRIAKSRFALEAEDFGLGIERFKRALDHLPSKRHARLRAMAKSIHDSFGRLVLDVTVRNRSVDAIALMCNSDTSIDLMLMFFYPDREPDGVILATITNHAVARLIERRLNPDPIDAVRGEFDQEVLDKIVEYILSTTDTSGSVEYGTEVVTKNGRFRVATELGDDHRTELTLVTWIAHTPGERA